MNDILNHSEQFPDLILEIFEFFSTKKTVKAENSNTAKAKTVMDFSNFYQEKYNCTEFPQPRVILIICDKLCEIDALNLIRKGGIGDWDSSYMCLFTGNWHSFTPDEKRLAVQRYECAVYGFTYIYQKFQSLVVPIVYQNENGDTNIGTGFHLDGGIATAKHCLVGAKSISIPNISKEQLENSKVIISEKPEMDIAYINLNLPQNTHMITNVSIPEVMEEIITLGYPKIPGFTHFQTVEKATIASLPQKRFTGTTGNVAAIAKEIWIRENLFLITAKIKGGNSGGPVINKFGDVIGIVSEITFGEGDYDDLGYGTAIPIKFLSDTVKNPTCLLEDITFSDYVD